MSQVAINPTGKQRPRLVLEQLGDDEVAGGGAVWTVTPRPFRTPMTSWEGTDALTWVLPLSFDAYDGPGARSVERDIATLEAWRRPSDSSDEPEILEVDAPLGRAPATRRWVITDVEWGEQLRNDAGHRVRQDIRLTLQEYLPGSIRKGPAAKSRDNRKGHKWVPISAKDRRCKRCKRKRDENKKHTNR
jgi:hypothetical protein